MKINFPELTLEEKVGQLIIVKPKKLDKRYVNELKVGGIFLNQKISQEEYKKIINFYKNNSKLNLFIAADMEGYWNSFSKFYSSKSFGKINDYDEALVLGKDHGKILKKLGFNLNFSPVVEVRNNVWIGRSFTGSDKEIKQKISGYIKGLHEERIFATAKHYPGGNLVKNPHLIKYKINATKQELGMFDEAIKSKVDFIMVGHPVIYGELNSNGKQATISPEIIKPLKEKFDGIVITDAVTMLGLRISYLFNFKKVYPDLIRAGNDIIIDTHVNSNYSQIKKRRDELIKQAKIDKDLEEKINESVKKILRKKGYKITD